MYYIQMFKAWLLMAVVGLILAIPVTEYGTHDITFLTLVVIIGIIGLVKEIIK